MFNKALNNMSVVSYVVIIASIWGGTALAADLPLGPEDHGEIPLLNDRLNQNLARMNQNIRKEARHHSDYILYGKSHRLHDFWQHLGQLKREQGEIIQRIVLLDARLEGQITPSDYRLEINKTHNGVLFSGPGVLSKMFSHWRGFLFLISGGFLLINISLFFACIEMERCNLHQEGFASYSKAA